MDPASRSVTDITELLSLLEARGYIRIGDYTHLKNIVDFDVRILQEIKKATFFKNCSVYTSKLLASLIRIYFPKRPSGAPLHTCTLSKLCDVPVGFVTPSLFWGCVLLYLRSPKGGCCSISDDLSCSSILFGKGLLMRVSYPKCAYVPYC